MSPSRKNAPADPAKAKIDVRTQEILRATRAFCDAHLDAEYQQLCEKLVLKMSRKRAVPYVLGRVETWAAAVVYALAQINFAFDKNSPRHITTDLVAQHFGVAKGTTTQKAQAIREMFKMTHWDPEFGTREMQRRNPLSDLVMVDGLIVPIDMLPGDVQSFLRPPRRR